MHFVRDREKRHDVSAFLTDRNHFDSLVVSATLMTDHFPWKVERAIADARAPPASRTAASDDVTAADNI